MCNEDNPFWLFNLSSSGLLRQATATRAAAFQKKTLQLWLFEPIYSPSEQCLVWILLLHITASFSSSSPYFLLFFFFFFSFLPLLPKKQSLVIFYSTSRLTHFILFKLFNTYLFPKFYFFPSERFQHPLVQFPNPNNNLKFGSITEHRHHRALPCSDHKTLQENITSKHYCKAVL